MEMSSEEDDDFPTHEWITPQSSINSLYQSHTEKGIRKICSELLELKDAVENLSGNMQSKYLAFLRVSEEVVEMRQEIIELRKHVSTQRILVQDLIGGVCRELEAWNKSNEDPETDVELQVSEINQLLHGGVEDPKITFLDTVDVLLAEHKIEETLKAIMEEEKSLPDLQESNEDSSLGSPSYKAALMKRKEMLVDQIHGIMKQPSICISEVKKAACWLVKLGEGPLGHPFLLDAYTSHIQKKTEAFIPYCKTYPETYTAVLSQLVFSTISLATKEASTIFGDTPTYMYQIKQWVEYRIEYFVQQVKENSPPLETASALHSASVCIEASLAHCLFLESQGLKLAKLIIIFLRPYVNEVIDMNFRKASRLIIDLPSHDDLDSPSNHLDSSFPVGIPSSVMFAGIEQKFMSITRDILDQLTPKATLHFGETILNKLHQLFDQFVETLMNALPSASEEDTIVEQKESASFKAETDAEQLALLGIAFTISDKLLPMAVSKVFNPQTKDKEVVSGSSDIVSSAPLTSLDNKDWKRQLQHSFDKLRDHFCRQYVLTFIYSREDEARLDARMYLEGKGDDDLYWFNNPLPSLPFRALFARLLQLASVASDVLSGKGKIQKVLLSRLTETVVMWLSEEKEFWDVFEDKSVQLKPLGLQQLILDMHFIVEISVYVGYTSRNIHQRVSAVIKRAIGAFSSRGIDPQSALPEDEWFSDTARTSITKLMQGISGYEASDIDEHIVINDEESDSDDTLSTPSTIESADSFASANMGEIDSPVYFTDPEG